MTPEASAILAAPEAEVFKADARSRVWRVDLTTARGGALVVKRFEHASWWQAVARRLGVHPAQRERRVSRRLARLGLPVPPILAWGYERCPGGVRAWLATPYRGRSLHNRLRDGDLAGTAPRRRAAEAVASLTAALLARGLFNRDHKASNILLDDAAAAWLIDVNGVRRSPPFRRRAHAVRMLATLHRSTREALASRADRLRVVRALARQVPELSGWKVLAAAVRRSLLK